MKKRISFKMATFLALFLSGAASVFHILALAGTIPMKYLWGGRLTSQWEVALGESLSLLVLLAFFFFTLVRAEMVKLPKLKKIARIGMWVLFLIFLLNTLGNILSFSLVQWYFITPLTALLTLLALRLALGKDEEKTELPVNPGDLI